MKQLKEWAAFALQEAKNQGADFAQVMVSTSEKKEFNIESGQFTLMRTLLGSSLSLSVFQNQCHGSVAINRLDQEAIREAARNAVAAAAGSMPDEAWEIDQSGRQETFTCGAVEADLDKLFARTKELLEHTKERHPGLMVEQSVTDHNQGKTVYMNTYGTTYEKVAGDYDFYIGYIAHGEGTSSHIFGSGVCLDNLDTPIIDCERVEQQMAAVERQASPVPFEGKTTGTVLFTPGCLTDVVVGTILGQFVSDGSLIEGTSPWKDKLGQQVADSRFSLRIAPSDPRMVCGQNFTGEGYLSEDFDIIRNGVLKHFYLSQYGANKTGQKRGGCTSSAYVCAPGEEALEDIIAGIEDGIYIGRFSGGQPGANGEFSGIAKNSFRIRNGKVCEALAETMISANLLDMLQNLRAVSRETADDGRISMPFMAFDGITISGK